MKKSTKGTQRKVEDHAVEPRTPLRREPEAPPIREVEMADDAGDGDGVHAGLAALEGSAAAGLLTVSGLYTWSLPGLGREELRLDVDGRYPQATASGTIYQGLTVRVHWIASLTPAGSGAWSGAIWYKDGNASVLPHTAVMIRAVSAPSTSQKQAEATFTGAGAASITRVYRWKSRYFHSVSFEFDSVQGVAPTTSIATCAHPNRPQNLACETLTIQQVYRRAGFYVSTSGQTSVIPLGEAGADALWSDMEMHDAMQTFWSRFRDSSQWAMWVLFAGRHEPVPSQDITPHNLGGVMFDDIGSNHRQGTAIFNDSFIAQAPAGDPAPAAAVARLRFWTACHEMGHAFNLAHSWQKAYGSGWIPLTNLPEDRSFMNYPYNVSGGQTAFFSDFEYRFGDEELLFLRHAPTRFVQMGNADWFDDHAFRQAEVSPEPHFALEARVHRTTGVSRGVSPAGPGPAAVPAYEFLEPVHLELKLKNISTDPQIVESSVLAAAENLTVIIKKRGKPARQWSSYSRRCFDSSKRALAPGQSIYGTVSVSSGLNGWDVSEPGVYDLQVALRLGTEDVVSNFLRLRVAPPRGFDEEVVAQDFFSDEVGRVLGFGGSRFLSGGNDVLQETAERLAKSRAALHARIALAAPRARPYKVLKVLEPAGEKLPLAAAADAGSQFAIAPPDPEAAAQQLSEVLVEKAEETVETLGHIDFKGRVDELTRVLEQAGEREEAAKAQRRLHGTLSARGVLKTVLEGIEARLSRLEKTGARDKVTG